MCLGSLSNLDSHAGFKQYHIPFSHHHPYVLPQKNIKITKNCHLTPQWNEPDAPKRMYPGQLLLDYSGGGGGPVPPQTPSPCKELTRMSWGGTGLVCAEVRQLKTVGGAGNPSPEKHAFPPLQHSPPFDQGDGCITPIKLRYRLWGVGKKRFSGAFGIGYSVTAAPETPPHPTPFCRRTPPPPCCVGPGWGAPPPGPSIELDVAPEGSSNGRLDLMSVKHVTYSDAAGH